MKNPLFNFSYSFCSFAFTIILVWLSLFSQNFFYGFWHDYGGIKANIEKYAPHNQTIHEFENTTKNERKQVFWQINYAVHVSPNTLKDITFTTTNNTNKTLLTADEIAHLEDVATLIQRLYIILLIMFTGWLCCLSLAFKFKYELPKLKKQIISLMVTLTAFSLVIIFIGPTTFFYFLHELIFTEGVPWFFYYEESLMSTMMAAPKLFGWIALSYLAGIILVFPLLQLVTLKLKNTISRKIEQNL